MYYQYVIVIMILIQDFDPEKICDNSLCYFYNTQLESWLSVYPWFNSRSLSLSFALYIEVPTLVFALFIYNVSELHLNLVLGGTAAVIHVWIFRSGGTGVLPLLAVVVLVVITVVVEPAVLVSGAVREELALGVVLTHGLAVRGGGHVGDVSDLILSPGAGHAMEKVVLAREVFLSVITVV